MGRRNSWGLLPCLGVLTWTGVAIAQNAETTRVSNVYAGPDDSYPVVAQLDEDTPVQVMGCLNDWSWCDVAIGDNRGWLYAPDLSYDYEGGYVPFYTYAPSFGIPIEQFSVGEYWDRYYPERPWYRRRDEWMHRSISEHRRPAGPPPSAGPPPRSARIDHPGHHEGDRPIRLGSAEEQRVGGMQGRAAPEPRGPSHPPPQEHAAPSPPEMRRAPELQYGSNAPQHESAREERAAQSQRGESQRRELPAREAPTHEPAARERPHEHPNDNPH